MVLVKIKEMYYFYILYFLGLFLALTKKNIGRKRCMYTYRVNLFKFVFKEKKNFL